jgi:hypothetical protein
LHYLVKISPDHRYGSLGTSASRGVAIFINKAVNHKVIDKFIDESGRIALLYVQIDDAGNVFLENKLYHISLT